MGQQTSRQHAPLTFGYIKDSSESIDREEEVVDEFDQRDLLLENPHLYKLQAICEQCTEEDKQVVLSSVINEPCNQCKRLKRLSLVKKDLAEDLEYIDQTYYPDLVHYTNNPTEDPMERELLNYQQQCSTLTIGDAVTPGTNIRRPRRLTGPSMAVDLSNKSLVKLSPSIGYLENLTKLNLSNNQMTNLPREIGHLKNLRVLNVNNNLIQNLPDTIAFLSKLKAFDVSNNKLVSLPSAIGRLSKLVILIANNNLLPSLPREFANLSNLISLNVSNNPLKSLPAEIAELSSLRKFLTENCPFEEEYTYQLKHDPPSLFEACARHIVRSKMNNIPNNLPEHIKHYLANPDTCSYCKGPFFESYVTRMRFIERRARQLLALEDRMCCAHWSTDEDRLLSMFSEQPVNAVDHSYHNIDMNGLHDTFTNRHRAYSDTSSNYNNNTTLAPSTYAVLKRSNTNNLYLGAEHMSSPSTSSTPALFLKPLPNLPALLSQQEQEQDSTRSSSSANSSFCNRPRASSTSSITQKINKLMRPNYSTMRHRSESTSSLSRLTTHCLTPSPLNESLPQLTN